MRFLLDGDLLLGRFPYDMVVTDWHAAIPTAVSRTGTHQWRSLVGIRAGVELGLR